MSVLFVFVFFGYRGYLKKSAKSTSVASLVKFAEELETKTELQQARMIYQKLIVEFPDSPQVSVWQRKIEYLNIKLLFSPVATKDSIIYEIKPNDTLIKIAREFNTTVELIMKSNNLTSDRIHPGKRIKIHTLPFSIVVDKSQNTLILKTDEEIIKTYLVATGLSNSTPTGNFKILNKLTNPTWFKSGAIVPPDSPENILGTRWLGFNMTGYGIHGTNIPESLGKQATQGCVRMSNQDVEEVYTIVPEGTEVSIVD